MDVFLLIEPVNEEVYSNVQDAVGEDHGPNSSSTTKNKVERRLWEAFENKNGKGRKRREHKVKKKGVAFTMIVSNHQRNNVNQTCVSYSE
jgi:hypothetical protein